MKRLRRWLFNGYAAISLLVALASGFAWARSSYVGDFLVSFGGSISLRDMHRNVDCIICLNGGVQFYHEYWKIIEGYSGSDSEDWFDGHYFRHASLRYPGFWKPDTHFGLPLDYPYLGQHWAPMTTDIRGRGFEIAYVYEDVPNVAHAVSITVPLPVIFFPTIVIFGLWLWRAINRRRRGSVGHCVICGYDLRATPDRCPECGAISKKVI
jgi:hypothetical protein